MNKRKLSDIHLSLWQRRLLIGCLVSLSGQLYLSGWTEGFRISAAAIVYPILLVTMMRDSHRPDSGPVTGLCVIAFRSTLSVLHGTPLLTALLSELPGGLFYLCYDALLCLLLRDRRTAPPLPLLLSLSLCDALSNILNLALANLIASPSSQRVFLQSLPLLLLLALFRSSAALTILWAARRYQFLLLHEEHEQRYRHLFLMTADLKTELYFLKKDAEDIEAVMSNAYRLYEKLEQHQVSEELTSLALSIARDVHEVKKDNLRIIRGIEEDVAGAYDGESMGLNDLLRILDVTTRQLLGSQRADIRLECRCSQNIPVREHYRLLSILKNLVTNAAEAIQADSGRGLIRVHCRTEGDKLLLSVSDNGPGIPPRSMKLLFQVGYSTKFDTNTGNISRGVGLPAVKYIIEELGGTIQVQSTPGQKTQFQIELPLAAVSGGDV